MVIRTPVGLSQRGRLAFLLKDSTVYGGASAISRTLSLITFPLIARHFSTESYGVIDFFGVLSTFLGVLVIFGQDSALARLFYEYEEIHQRQRLISQSILLQLMLSVLVTASLMTWAIPIASLLIDVPDGSYLLNLIAIQVPFVVLMQFSQTLLKWSFQRNRFLLISLGYTLTNVTLLIIAIYGFNIGVAGMFWIGIISNALYSMLGVWFVRSWLVLPKDLGYLKELVRYALPLGVICSAGAIVPTLERWLTADLLGMENLGLYAVGTRVAMLITLFVSAFQTAWGPFSLSLYKQNDAIVSYNMVLKSFVLAMMTFSLLLGAVAYPLITILATDRFALGAVLVFPLALALVIQATSWITEIGIGISKRSYLSLYAYAAFVIVTIAGIYILAPLLDLVGVALGVLFGHVTKSVISSWLAQSAYPLAWSYGVVLKYICIVFSSGLVVLLIYRQYGAVLGSALYMILAIGLFLVGVKILFSQDERLKAWDFLLSKLASRKFRA
jgi:O-antigen/teichoic acid export membrane protein